MNTASQNQDTRDSREIQDDIRSTRGDMDRTLDRLNDRLSPRAILGDIMDWFESRPSSEPGVVAEKSGDVLRLVKENPVPALFTGVGIAWLIAESKNSGRASGPRYSGQRMLRSNFPSPNPDGSEPAGLAAIADRDHSQEPGALDKVKGKLTDASGKVSDTIENAKDKVAGFGDSVSERASEGFGSVKDSWSSAQDSAAEFSSDLGAGAAQNLRAVNKRFGQAVDEVPLGVGLGFLGLGVLAGLLLPRTETEDELMGDAADDLKDHVADKGEDLMERGKNVASRVADKAMQEADKQGLTPDAASDAAATLSDKVRSVVDEATSEGKEAATDEGLTAGQLTDEAEGEAAKLADDARRRLDENPQP